MKTLREERRKSDRSHYDVTVEMKKIWEDLRRHDLPKDQRMQLSEKVAMKVCYSCVVVSMVIKCVVIILGDDVGAWKRA